MSGSICTFSGKYGDILWSLATAKYISEHIAKEPVDFAVMPYYQNLLPLLACQPYIDWAFVVKDWFRTHSNHGDQPWQPPPLLRATPMVGNGWSPYDREWHLTYRGHPGITAPSMPLVEFIAYQQGISFAEGPVPFIQADPTTEEEASKLHFSSGSMMKVIVEKRLISYAFNEQYGDLKKVFFEELWKETRPDGLEFFNVAEVGWKEAAWIISKSIAYVGCRSACWVLAMGLGQETFTFEPHPSRHKDCHLGRVFGSPYGKEMALPYGLPPAAAASTAASLLRAKLERVAV